MFSLIRYLLLFLAGILLVRLVADKWLGGARRRSVNRERSRTRSGQRPRTIRGKTVRDAHCGMHVARNLAISARSQGRRLFFCSEECRDAYLEGLQPTGTDA